MPAEYGQPGYVPKHPPADFTELYVGGVKVEPGAETKKMNSLKPLKGDVDSTAIVRAYNELIAELKIAGLMANK